MGLGGGLMATIQFKKNDEYLAKLSKLDYSIKDKVIGPALYDGAAIVADSVREGINSLPTSAPGQWGTAEDPLPGPSPKQKEGLLNSLGIATMKEDSGYFNVKLGFDGYNDIKSKTWPQGQPNQLIARSIERGTSFMEARPFMKRSISRVRNACINAMKARADEEIEKIMKG